MQIFFKFCFSHFLVVSLRVRGRLRKVTNESKRDPTLISDVDKVILKYHQMIPGHGSSHRWRTIFGSHLFKYGWVRFQTFNQVFGEPILVDRLALENHLKSFSDAYGSHKTQVNLSARAYSQLFPDW